MKRIQALKRLSRAAINVVERMEDRRMFSALSPSSSFLVFNASTSGPASRVDTLTITNTGSSTLAFNGNAFTIVHDPADASNESAQFAITNPGSLPTSLAPAQSAQVQIDYTASIANTIQSALLQITSNDPTNPVTSVQLHGLGTNGQFGTNEPSLVDILRANDIPTIVGAGPNDVNASNSQYPESPDPSSQEVLMQQLVKAGPGPVTITPLASFNSSVATTVRLGYYTPGDPADKTELFTIGQADAQAVNPTALGATSFDPGSNSFSLYGTFPGTTTPDGSLDVHYSEDALNKLDPSNPRKFRFFPMKNPDGSVVPNTYIVAAEDYNNPAYNSFTNFVGIISNVKPVAAGPVLGLVNLQPTGSADRLVFNRIESVNPNDPAGFVDTVDDTATLQINNTGTQPLVINGLTLSDNTNWQIVNPPAPGTIVAANGGILDVTIKFIATTVPVISYNQTNDTVPTNGTPALQAGGVWNGTLTISSNDPTNPTRTVQLAGYLQTISEDETEPGLQTLTNLVLGYGTTISNAEQPEYPNNGSAPVYYGEEVPSGLWDVANPSQQVSVLQIAAWHNQFDPTSQTYPGTTLWWYAAGSSPYSNTLFRQAPGNSQSLFPALYGTTNMPAAGSFSPNGAFGFNIDGESSQDSLNTTDISLGRSGHSVRFFPVRDGSGNLVPNTWLMVMDYQNGQYDNSDFQDNMYLVTNVRPATQAPAVTDLEAVGASNAVSLAWAPISDGNLIGYNVYRSSSPTGIFTKLNSSPLSKTSFIDTTAPAGVPSYYEVTAIDSTGESEAADASAQPLNTLTTTLASLDVNSSIAGATTVVTPGSAYSVTGGGADIAGTNADGFRYVYQEVNGDFDAEVQVSSLTQNVQPSSRAGLMVRDSLDAGSQMVFAGVTATDGYRFNYRTTENQIGVYNTIGSVFYPNTWVRLVRKGNEFSTYSSIDGISWTLLGSVEMALPSTLFLGMAVSSHTTTQTVTAQFQNYSVSGTPTTIIVTPPPAGTATSIFGTTSAPASNLQNINDPTIPAGGGVELGMKFRSDVAGVVTGVRFFKGSLEAGTQTGELWSSTGQLLATATFTNESASGWQQVSFSSPVSIAANTTYIVSYHTTSAYIAYTSFTFSAGDVDSAPLHALANGVDGNNGVYVYGASAFPSVYNGQAPNYWVDVVFSTTAIVGPLAPSAPSGLVATVASPTQVSLTWTVSTGTVTAYHVERSTNGGAFVEIAGSVMGTTYIDSTTQANNTYAYQVRAENSGAFSGYSNTQQVSTTVTATTVTLFSSTSAPASNQQNINDPTIPNSGGVELGVKFRSDVSGVVTGVRFYKGSLNTGTHTGELWSSTGQLLATATFTNESASGWQQVTFSNPVAIAANTTYIVSYHTTSAYISYAPSQFTSAGIDNAPLHALANGVDGNNGVYKYGASSFPSLYNGQAPSYWVDVVFSAATVTPTTPSAPTNLTVVAASSSVALSWTASTGTVTAYHVERSTNGGAFVEIAASVQGTTFTDSTVQAGTTYTYQVRAENSGVFSGYSNAPQVTTPTVVLATSVFSSSAAPASNSQNINDPAIPAQGGVELGVKFTSDVAGTITGVRFYKGSQNTGAHTGELWSGTGQLLATASFANETASGWQQVTFSSPVTIAANTVYIVSYHTTSAYIAYTGSAFANAGMSNSQLHLLASGVSGGNSVYKYGPSSFPALSNGQSPNYWVDVVFAPTTPVVTDPLTSLDIAATLDGSTTVITPGSDYSVSAGGPQMYGTSDGFRFLYEQLTGNFDIEVQVANITVAGANAQAGLMARTSLDPASQEVSMTTSPSTGYRFKDRDTADGITNTATVTGPQIYPNVWVRLQRVGNVFTGYYSTDGINWTSTGSVTLALLNTLYVGLAAASNDATDLTTVQFRGFGNTAS